MGGAKAILAYIGGADAQQLAVGLPKGMNESKLQYLA